MKRYLGPIPQGKGCRPPLISFKELAEAVGLTVTQLAGRWAAHPVGRPEPQFRHQSGSTKAAWFNRAEAVRFARTLKASA